MNKNQVIATLGAPLLALLAASAVRAEDAEPVNTVRAGIYIVQYHASSTDLSGPYTPPGLQVKVNNVNTVYLAYLRELSYHWELELAAGVPPKTDQVAKGPATVGSVPYNGQTIGSAKWFSPTLLLNYKFRYFGDKFWPYAGVGMNYTHLYDLQITPAGQAIGGGPTKTTLSDSYGPAATVGARYAITREFNIAASFSASKIKSNASLNSSGITRTATIDFKPTTWVISAGYSF